MNARCDRARRRAPMWVCWCVLAIAGCGGSSTRTPGEPAEIKDLTAPGVTLSVDAFLTQDIATISPGDFLDLRILGFPELSGTFLVAQDGRINLSLIGSVQAAGKSADELDRELTTAYGAYYRNLDVAVNVNTRAERYRLRVRGSDRSRVATISAAAIASSTRSPRSAA